MPCTSAKTMMAAVGLLIATCGCAVACELMTATNEPAFRRVPLATEDRRLLSGFGLRFDSSLGKRTMHNGVAWGAPIGSAVQSVARGIVLSVKSTDQGVRVVIAHGAGWHTGYARLGKASVTPGDCVESAGVIGEMGQPERDSVPYVEYQILRHGQFINPMSLGIKRVDMPAVDGPKHDSDK